MRLHRDVTLELPIVVTTEGEVMKEHLEEAPVVESKKEETKAVDENGEKVEDSESE